LTIAVTVLVLSKSNCSKTANIINKDRMHVHYNAKNAKKVHRMDRPVE
jgi:hypothetical protein